MINFFRKIRKRTADDQKPLKYVRYAIGEVVLVVIGILIALSINNWNQRMIERENEQTLLKQLKKEYQENLEKLDKKIGTRNIIIRSAKDLLTYFDDPDGAIEDSVLVKLNDLGLATTYDPIENDVVRSGKVSIITSEKLKQLLTRWSSDVIQVKESENVYFNRYFNQIAPFLFKKGFTRPLATIFWKNIKDIDYLMNNDLIKTYDYGRSRHEIGLSELLDDVELESMVANAIGSNTFSNLESYTLRKKILEILTILNLEIKED